MRDSGAPEARGSKQTARCRLAGAIGLPALLFLALSPSPFPPEHDRALASGAADAVPRQLQVASDDVQRNFILPDLEGTGHELKQQAGRVVLVHFFAGDQRGRGLPTAPASF